MTLINIVVIKCYVLAKSLATRQHGIATLGYDMGRVDAEMIVESKRYAVKRDVYRISVPLEGKNGKEDFL